MLSKLLLSPWLLRGSLIVTVLMGITIGILRFQLADARETIQVLETWQRSMVTSVRLASGNPKVTKDTAQVQLQALGKSIDDLKDAVQRGNERVDEMVERSRLAQERAAAETVKRKAAVQKAEAARDALRNAKPSDSSEATLRELQDQAYEGGL